MRFLQCAYSISSIFHHSSFKNILSLESKFFKILSFCIFTPQIVTCIVSGCLKVRERLRVALERVSMLEDQLAASSQEVKTDTKN